MKLRNLCLFFVLAGMAAPTTQAREGDANAIDASTQLVAVTTSDWNAVEGRLQRYERANAHKKWKPVGDPISVVVGKNGGFQIITSGNVVFVGTTNLNMKENCERKRLEHSIYS